MKPKQTAIERVTNSIIEKLESGTVPWSRPWKGGASGMPANLVSKKPYRGFNVFALGLQGYGSRFWGTYKQLSEQGAQVSKGEKSTPIVFWKFNKEEKGEDGSITRNGFGFIRYYNVFNLEQTDGYEPEESKPSEWDPIEGAEKVVKEYELGPKIRTGEDRAYYVPARDFINMPEKHLFHTAEGYYATLFHEMGHSTGHENRLNRKTLTDLCPFGSTNYSKEELVAELSAAMLCGFTGIENSVIDNSAAYIAGWLKKLRDDRRLIISAAAQAQKAVDHILGIKKESEAGGE